MVPSKDLCLILHHSRKLKTWEAEGCNTVLRHYKAMHLCESDDSASLQISVICRVCFRVLQSITFWATVGPYEVLQAAAVQNVTVQVRRAI